ncbi:glutathione S-transferase family protein [Phenylobacterium sp.]|uniref:glutathione S-transferase family protein n=1 Tax=Phenylobacterium sp. TaxID=1871053 RepID=UPI00391DBDB8
MKIIGSFVSPYVRKVLACLVLKGLDYEIDPITPFFGDDTFERLSPLRRIPVLIDGDLTLCDSSVICAYLDEAYPGRALLPADPKDRARARWFEEFADTRLGDVFIWGLFYQRNVRPVVWGEPCDEARVEKSLSTDIPAALDYLERELPAAGFLFGDVGLADISLASFFRNAAYAGFEPDPARWPKTAAYVARVLAEPCFATLLPFEDVQRSVNPAGRRAALLEAGAPLTAETLGTRTPKRGVMAL